jgi:hypothetical protein
MTLQVLGSTLELKDAETEAHCVTAYTISIATSVPVPLQFLNVLARAAFLHDIGKMAIPDKILRKPGALDDSEKQIMRTHCEIGYNTLIRVPFLREAADIVLAHPEFFDGTGYPRGLRREQIPLARKIHDFRSTKGLAMVQIRYLGRFETKSEAFACPNIPQQTVFFFQIFLIDRWSRSLTNGRAVPMAERFCSRLPSGAWS